MKIKSVTVCGVLTALALIIHIIEAQIPALVPISGIKPGLSNIVTLFALVFLSPAQAFFILAARILLSAFISSPSALIYSLAGGIGCLIAEALLLKLLGSKYIWGISAFGAMVHNTLQLLTAAIITQTPDVFFYLPFLLISGIITGLFTGLCVFYLNKKLKNKLKTLFNQRL